MDKKKAPCLSLMKLQKKTFCLIFVDFVITVCQKLNSFAHQIMPKKSSEDRYKTAFDMVQEHLNRGDSYLVNLTFPTGVSFNGNIKDLFHNAQSQYKVLFKDQFVSYSPECFVKIKGNTIYSYPMKGTISTAIPNAEQRVLGNPKEIAEHATIVDLIRNDLSFYASEVRVNRFRYLEQINVNPESLLQVSSEIEGTLKNDWKANLGNLPCGFFLGVAQNLRR